MPPSPFAIKTRVISEKLAYMKVDTEPFGPETTIPSSHAANFIIKSDILLTTL